MTRFIRWIVALILTAGLTQAEAQEKVLWNFQGPPNDGAQPTAKVTPDASGNLYGTTQWGGTQGWGTVFELSPVTGGGWIETILYSFCENFNGMSCVDGAQPTSALIFDSAGNLYGTTYSGGSEICPYQSAGCGTVFELSPPASGSGAWTYAVLYNFCAQTNCADGALPYAKLQFDSAANLYGTTSGGGTAGVVFELSPTSNGWAETVLYDFCSKEKITACPDGSQPKAGVVFDTAGNIYGTTSAGGSAKFLGGGVVYKLVPTQNGWQEKVLYAFQSGFGTKGGDLLGEVNFDRSGNLYSTSFQGGSSDLGGVFRLSPTNGGSETTLSFDGTNGATPAAGVLIDPRHTTLYGTTSGLDYDNLGTVFKVSGKQVTVLHHFSGGSDGAVPLAALDADKKGNLYGTTEYGGSSNLGTVFQIEP